MADDRELGGGLGSEGLDSGWDDLEPIAEQDLGDLVPEDGSVPGSPGAGRRAAVAAGRAVGGMVGLGAAVVLIGGLSLLPLPSVAPQPDGVSVLPAGAEALRVCAGSALLLGNDPAAEELALTPVGSPARGMAGDFPVVATALDPLDVSGSGSTPRVLSLDGGDGASLLAGSELVAPGAPSVVGLIASACADTANESWLVGGSTETGRTSLVQLSNPGGIDASVTLTVYGEAGEAGVSGAIPVPAGASRVVSLASYARQVASPVVLVQSEGGQVTAHLQQTVVRSLEPGGSDRLSASPSPASTVTIPGVEIATAAGVESRYLRDGYADLGTAVRIFVPGTGETEVTVQVHGEGATPFDSLVTVPVTAGVVVDLPLESLPDDRYSVTVTAQSPLLAAVRSSVYSAAGTDLAWYTAAAPLDDRALVGVAQGPSATLSVMNPHELSATVQIETETGALSLEVPSGRSASISVPAGSLELTGVQGMSAAVSYRAGGQLAAFPVLSTREAPAEVLVYP